MADFLSRLAERSLGLARVARPRIAPLFAAGTRSRADGRFEALDGDLEASEAAWPEPTGPARTQALAAVSPTTPQAGELPESPLPRQLPRSVQPLEDAPVVAAGPAPLVAPRPRRGVLQPARPEAGSNPLPFPSADHSPINELPARAYRAGPSAASSALQPAPLVSRTSERTGGGEVGPEGARERFRPRAARPQPAIRVTIGRIEVHAVFPAAKPGPARAQQGPQLTLQDYVKQRGEGRR
jgi:hypothetical protein